MALWSIIIYISITFVYYYFPSKKNFNVHVVFFSPNESLFVVKFKNNLCKTLIGDLYANTFLDLKLLTLLYLCNCRSKELENWGWKEAKEPQIEEKILISFLFCREDKNSRLVFSFFYFLQIFQKGRNVSTQWPTKKSLHLLNSWNTGGKSKKEKQNFYVLLMVFYLCIWNLSKLIISITRYFRK